MGPEIIAAIVGPLVGGAISIFVWTSKKNYEFMNEHFSSVNTTVNVIERKLDDLRLDVAKNYVTNDELMVHIRGEAEWHSKIESSMEKISDRVERIHDAQQTQRSDE